jgi:hypothetical protein
VSLNPRTSDSCVYPTVYPDDPGVVADAVLKAAGAANPKLRYTAGVLAGRLRLLRTYAPAGLMDAGIRKDLRLDTATR